MRTASGSTSVAKTGDESSVVENKDLEETYGPEAPKAQMWMANG